jgi:hypothetical protein
MRWISVVALISLLAGCAGGGTEPAQEPVELLAPETFTWTGQQPVSFSPPGEGWRSSRYQNGGTEGVDFVKTGSIGEQIYVAEHFFLGRRDRCSQIAELLRTLEGYEPHAFDGAARKAKLYVPDETDPVKRGNILRANEALDAARESFRSGDLFFARVELERALEHARCISYTIDETVDRVLFTKARNPVYPSLEVEPPEDSTLAGLSAVMVRFTFEAHGESLLGRRVYVVANNRLFAFGYQGLPENLPLFEQVLETVSFPSGPCAH